MSYCFAFSLKPVVFYWSIEIQHFRKHCSVTSPILFVIRLSTDQTVCWSDCLLIRLSTDKQFTTRIGRDERESDWCWCQVTQLCVSISLHLDRSNVTKYGNSLRVQLCVRLSRVRLQQSHVSLQPVEISPRLLYCAYSVACWQAMFFFSAANRMTRRARKHHRLLPRTLSFIFHPSIHQWTPCSLRHQPKT
jgi:hypothetical protein